MRNCILSLPNLQKRGQFQNTFIMAVQVVKEIKFYFILVSPSEFLSIRHYKNECSYKEHALLSSMRQSFQIDLTPLFCVVFSVVSRHRRIVPGISTCDLFVHPALVFQNQSLNKFAANVNFCLIVYIYEDLINIGKFTKIKGTG